MTPHKFPADRVERRNVADLIPDAKNARTHSDDQVAQIARVIQEWGWTVPIIVEENNKIVAGHERVLAAQSLGYTSVPVITVTGWSDAQKQAYMLADNKLPQNATWDMDKLAVGLAELAAILPDITVTGFSEEEVRNLTAQKATEGKTDPDDVPDAPVEPITAPGDVWLLGRHRLTCGDPTDPETVDTALAGVLPHLMLTDLPTDPARGKGKAKPAGTAEWQNVFSIFGGSIAYVWHEPLQAGRVIDCLLAAGYTVQNQIIWAREHAAPGRTLYRRQHEPRCRLATARAAPGTAARRRRRYGLSRRGHRAIRSDCRSSRWASMAQAIENRSGRGQAVFGPFASAGTGVQGPAPAGTVLHRSAVGMAVTAAGEG